MTARYTPKMPPTTRRPPRGLRTPLRERRHGRLVGHARRGAPLLAVARAAGITWTLARTRPGDRNRERQLKAQGGASRRCPASGITPNHRRAEGTGRNETATRA